MTSKIGLLFFSFFLSILLSILLYDSWTFSKWLDAVFLTGLFLLMIASFMSLIEGQFFKAFIDSTRNFFAKVNKKEQLIRESERRNENFKGYKRSFPMRKNIFFVGLLLTLLSLAVSAALFYA